MRERWRCSFLEAGFLWGRRGYDLSGTLGNNFNPAMLEVGVPAAWQVLAFGLLFVLGAFVHTAFARGAGLAAKLSASRLRALTRARWDSDHHATGPLARRATAIPASTIAPPMACSTPKPSPSQTQPNIAAVSGSMRIAKAEKEAGRWPSA
jgi:hypothetical protein